MPAMNLAGQASIAEACEEPMAPGRTQRPITISALTHLAFFLCVVRPIVWMVLGAGVGVARRSASSFLFPAERGALVVANHNSHLDPFVLMCLIPWRDLWRVRVVVAADYFLERPLIAWFYVWALRMIPIEREHRSNGARLADVLRPVDKALARQEIILYFPEGTRGEPGVVGPIKYGIVNLASRWPEVPVLPVLLRGLDIALPKGSLIVVPQEVDVTIGEPLTGTLRHDSLRQQLADFWS